MRKTKLTLLLLAALLVGVCIGFYANNAVIQARIRHFSRIPGNMPEHLAQKLTERLELDAAQQEAVRAILVSYDGRLQEARDQSRATLDALFAGMRGEIAAHLNPEQKLEQQKMIAEFEQRRQSNRDLRRALRVPSPATTNAAK